MTKIFISHSHQDLHCAEKLLLDLEQAGYEPWKDTQSIHPGNPSYVRAIENGIRGCAAVVVIWSKNAAQSEWVEREILYAQQLKKPIFPIIIDDTPLSILIIAVQGLTDRLECSEAVSHLLPYLPPPAPDDGLQVISTLLSHEHISQRKQGIEAAAHLLANNEQTEPVLALLEDIARKDPMTGVRELAQQVIHQYAASAKDRSPVSRHVFGVRCPNGHISYFDRRKLCPESGMIKRSVRDRGGKELDDLYLKCPECGEDMVVTVDCEGYK